MIFKFFQKLNKNKYKTVEKEKNRLDDDEILNKNILEEEKEINPLKETEKNQGKIYNFIKIIFIGNQTVREKELEYWDKIVIETKFQKYIYIKFSIYKLEYLLME